MMNIVTSYVHMDQPFFSHFIIELYNIDTSKYFPRAFLIVKLNVII